MITIQDLARTPLFQSLSAETLAGLAPLAADVRLATDEWLLREGDRPAFFIILEGRLQVVKTSHAMERALNTYEAGDFLGEVPLLLGSPAIASLKALAPTRLARFEEEGFRTIVGASAQVREQVLEAMHRRIGMLQTSLCQNTPPPVRIIGHRYDKACHDLRTNLTRNQVRVVFEEPEAPPETCPIVELPDGTRLVQPKWRSVAEKVNLRTQPSRSHYDVIIVGAGPAGLAAAVYGASEGLTTLLVERDAPGGQAGTSNHIDNYLGFPNGVTGDELANRAYLQARHFHCDTVVARSVEKVEPGKPWHAVTLDGGDLFRAGTVVVAAGVAWRHLDVEGVESLLGRGIYYGSSPTDALESRDRDVFIVGGGNSAGQAAVHLSKFARSVTMVVRGASLEATMSQYLIKDIRQRPNIWVRNDCVITAVHGDEHLTAVTCRNRATGEEVVEEAGALFLLIGGTAQTGWLPGDIIRDEDGYICTGRDIVELGGHRWPLLRDPYLLETSVPGIFAVGDVRHGSIKRVASAVGEGSMAIALIHRYRDVAIQATEHLAKASALARIGLTSAGV